MRRGAPSGSSPSTIYDDSLHLASAVWAAWSAWNGRAAATQFIKVFGSLFSSTVCWACSGRGIPRPRHPDLGTAGGLIRLQVPRERAAPGAWRLRHVRGLRACEEGLRHGSAGAQGSADAQAGLGRSRAELMLSFALQPILHNELSCMAPAAVPRQPSTSLIEPAHRRNEVKHVPHLSRVVDRARLRGSRGRDPHLARG